MLILDSASTLADTHKKAALIPKIRKSPLENMNKI